MNCRVVVEAAVPVYDVETADEAVRIAISKTGEMLNPDLNYVEINMGERSCPHCGEEFDPAFLAADESLVALELEMTVFNVERDEHAARIARKEIGQRLENIPLEVLEIEEIPEDDDEDEEATESEGSEEANEAVDGPEEGAAEEPVSDEGSDDEGLPDPTGEEQSESEPADAPPEIELDAGGDDRSAEGGASDDDEVLPEFEELIDE